MSNSPLSFFTDAVLRAPTIGSMLMCFAAALVGVIVFLRKQSLLGESLSHSAYPGVILGVIIAGLLNIDEAAEGTIGLLIMIGAFFSAMAGLWAIHFLVSKMRVRNDSALCFVLSGFFGVGLTLASQVQFSYTSLYRKIQVYLYGQAATMTDIHIVIYGALSLLVLLIILMFYKEIQAITFDRNYSRSLGINTHSIDTLVFLLIVLAVVIGIRSVGVVLMSAMLIAPAAAARQFTNKLYEMFIWAAAFGLFSGFFGNYFSVEMTHYLAYRYPGLRLALPTGPMIVLIASLICLLALFLAPERGMIWRMVRIARFRYQCLCENILKTLWRLGVEKETSLNEIKRYQTANTYYLMFILFQLARNGWIKTVGFNKYRLTPEGALWAAKIVRLHRLWEVYLADYLGVGVERVHRSAEEMEHIITPELERELTLLLKDPKQDPHHQPIPPLQE